MSSKQEPKGMQPTAKRKLLPRLRFPEFRDAGKWEEKTIGDSCDTFSGGTPNTSNKEFYGGTIPFIRSAEIDKVQTELFLTNEGLINSAAKMVRRGDILVALYGANSGDVALSKIEGAINQAILCLRHENNNVFVYQYLARKKSWIISTYIQGGQGNLSGEIVKSVKLFFPHPREQQKIAGCLASIDDLITLETQKLDALRSHGKGLMQQLFPAEGQTLPQLRFPEFRNAGEWEEKGLGELLEFKNGINASKEQYGRGTKFINVLDILQNEFITYEKIIGSVDISDSMVEKFSVNYGDILFQRSSETQEEVGTASVYLDKERTSTFGGFVIRGKKIGKYEPTFLNKLLKSQHIRNSISSKSGGSTRFNIGQESLSAVKIFLPSTQEQKKVADCLTSLDESIALQAQKIDALKLHKKGLMQQLFPAVDEVSG